MKNKFNTIREVFIDEVSVVDMPTKYGNFKLHTFVNKYDNDEHHIALVKGDVNSSDPCLFRIHSECLTGDVFGSCRCDCGFQLDMALRKISEEGKGVVMYLKQEGRGIGFVNKMKAYEFQENGFDTIEANEKLGYSGDLRDYGFGTQIINNLGIKKVRLMTNNPTKVIGLKEYDIEIVEEISIEVGSNIYNEKYLKTKRDRMGHKILQNSHK